MIRDGFLYKIFFVLLILTLFAVPASAAKGDGTTSSTIVDGTLSTAVNPDWRDTLNICLGDTIYDTVKFYVPNVEDEDVNLWYTNGKGDLIVEKFPEFDSLFGYWSYVPIGEDYVDVIYYYSNADGDSTVDQHRYFIYYDADPPTLEDQYFSDFSCDLKAYRYLNIDAPDGVNFELISGPGSIDPQTGVLSYIPDTSGVFNFEIAISNNCGADTALVVDSLWLNTPPQVFCYDSLVYLCEPQEICFDVFGFDPDEPQVDIVMLEGLGNFTLTSDTSGTACFTPADVDSAVYMFIFRAADSCISNLNKSNPVEDCCRDTSLITVIINRPPVIECPEPQTFFACESSEFCFPISATDPNNDELTFNILSQNAYLDGDSLICVTGAESGEFTVEVEVVDECGEADTCQIPVSININQPPVVTLADNFEMTLCTPETICFRAQIDDIDNNIESVYVNNGIYNKTTNQICFDPDTSGVYSIEVIATDSCGLSDTSYIDITVDLNGTPEFSLGDDFAKTICLGEEICVDVSIFDDNLNHTYTNFGYLSADSNKFCFTPDSAGVYTLIAGVVDDCDVTVEDTLEITVTVKESGYLTLDEPAVYELCEPEELCVGIITNLTLESLEYNIGQLVDNQICFTPDTAGTYTVIAGGYDECGNYVTDSVEIEVSYGSAPVITNLNDTTVYICNPQSICLPFDITDLDNDIASVTVSRGTYDNGQVCFVPYDSGSYEIIVTVTDSCGNVAVDTANVYIDTDQDVNLIVPNDTTFFTCELDTFCFPVSGIPEGAEVSVTGINSWYDAETSSICYYAECASANKITLTATTECNSFSKQFTVTVLCNTEPLAILPQDTTIFMCEPAEICLPVGVSDVDDNLKDVIVTGGSYDETFGTVCFTPDTAGVYTLTVSATDSCGATDYDEIFVEVGFNSAPICNIPEDQNLFLCESGQTITLPVSAFDSDGNLAGCYVTNGFGSIVDDSVWTYTANAADSFTVVINCEDECGEVCVDSFTVKIDLNNAPVCDAPSDTSFNLCEITEVSLPFTSFDPDGDSVVCTITDGPGLLVDGNWVYTPAGNETVSVTVLCEDECGATCESTFSVEFTINETPVCNIPNDTTIFLCDLSEIRLPYSVTDDDSAVCRIVSGPGQLLDGFWTYTPEGSDTITVVINCFDECEAFCEDSFTVILEANEAPSCSIESIDSLFLCNTEMLSFPITTDDINGNYTYCEIISGPGTIDDNNNWTYTPTGNENISVTIRCYDECSAYCESTFETYIEINESPVLEDQNFSFDFCYTNSKRILEIISSDGDDDALYFELLSGAGTIDPETGAITYYPDTTGTYTFEIMASDECDTVYATITDVITINERPTLNIYDSTIVLCDVQEICFDITGTDPDDDSIYISLYDGPGQFTQTSPFSGTTCFTPENIDSATYAFVYCVFDDCYNNQELTDQPRCYDTVKITVLINQAPQISCPEPANFFVCETDTFCFDVSATDPENDPVTFNVLSGNATIDGNTVCIVGAAAGQFDLSIEAVDTCGHADTCTIPVTIEENTAPTVNTADDFTASFCEAQEICFPVYVGDVEANVVSVIPSIGYFNDADNLICFTPDTAGVYEVIVTVADECGAEDVDTTYVTVELNDEPVVDAGEDFSVSICASDSVCFDVSIIDENLSSVISNIGNIDPETGKLCFYADSATVYDIKIEATDSCGLTTSDNILVTVLLSEGPFVDLGDDIDTMLCEITEICLPVSTVSNYTSIDITGGALYNEQTSEICFTPEEPGLYSFTVSVTDTCGLSASDTINVNVDFNSAPVMTNMPDTSLYLCMPQSICLPIEISDVDDNIVSITTNMGTYADGQVCFVPYDSGTYNIIVTATDECGEIVADTASVHILTDQSVDITFPNDTSFFTCELDTVCLPIEGIPANSEITIDGINTWYDAANGNICFYPECATANKITVHVNTPCNEFTGQFTVTVNCNTQPLIILPQDTVMTLCGPTEVCLPIGVTDVDGNLTSVIPTNAEYDKVLSQLCFYADTAGIYTLSVVAEDSCGATDYDEIQVQVKFNSAPEISLKANETNLSCDNEQICVEALISDIDNNLVSVTSSLGTYEPANNVICFVPDTSGTYCLTVVALDACGFETTDSICVDVEVGGYVTFECPTEPLVADSLCGAGQVCVPLDISGEVLSVLTSFGSFDNGQLCFDADTAGLYTINVTATADCNEISCDIQVRVYFKDDVTIECPGDLDTLLCSVDTLCFDLIASSTVQEITSSSNAYVNGTQVCVPILEDGEYVVTVYGSGECGLDSCSFTINAVINSAPVITVKDTSLTVCEFDTVCVPFTATDINNNIMEIVAIGGSISDGYICILPTQYGDNIATLTVTDNCGESVSKLVNVNLTRGADASIICPGDQYATLCGADSFCVVVPISPADADIRILDNGIPIEYNYNWTTGDLCFFVQSSGNHSVTVIADAMCSSDTCNFDVQVTIAEEPQVTCPSQIDTLICLNSTDSISFPITAEGTGIDVTVNPAGTYAGGNVTIPVDAAGTYEVEIIAASDCGADTCITTINVTADSAPLLVVPNDTTFEWCPGDTNSLCIPGIYASDVESIVSLNQVCGSEGAFTAASVDSGEVCFVPESAGLYMFCFEANDGCNSVMDTFYVDILEKEDCDVCSRVIIDGGESIPVGGFKHVYINIETNTQVAGFDLLLSFDASVLAFSTATIEGTAIDNWEYFDYRLGSEDCGSACPSGLVRLVGIADLNNGTAHPPASAYNPEGVLVDVTFQVSNDQTLGDLFIPINFVWFDCGDNSFSNITGNLLYIDSRIYNYENYLIWDEFDDVTYPEENRQFGLGAPDECTVGDKEVPQRCVEFINGGIDIIHPDSIDDRGDLNLNNFPYEIADAVLYSNYFIYGLGVFTINVAGQIAASDVNADGLTLSVADLVLLIRVVIGDADGLPKVAPYSEDLILSTNRSGDEINVETQSVSNIGAGLMVFDIDPGLNINRVDLGRDASDMEYMYDIVDNQLRVLIYDIGSTRIDNGANEILSISTSGVGNITLTESDFVDYQSRAYQVSTKVSELPTGFELSQNFPNPFNPSTTIQMALPTASDWTLSIFNINGHLVKRFNGTSEPGYLEVVWDGTNEAGAEVASGMYLYRLEASGFSNTKKMILLK